MVPAVIFQPATIGVGFVIIPTFSHKIAFMEFMNEDVWAFLLLHGIIYPDLFRWDELIDVIMPSLCEFYIENTSNQPSINYPNADPVL
jgi:hypothetical protein